MVVDLVKLPGLKITRYGSLPDGSIEIAAEFVDDTAPSFCPSCRGGLFYRHGVRSSKYADIPIDSTPVRLIITWPRHRCRQCRTMTTQPFDFVDEKRRATTRLVDFIQRKCLDITFSSLAKQTGLAVNTIKNIALDLIAEIEANTQVETPVLLGLSEIAMGTKCRTVITNLATRTIFNILEEITPDFLANYFRKVPGKENIQWVCLDRRNPFKNSFGDIFPNARPVISKAYVVNIALDIMEEVRKKHLSQIDGETRHRVEKSLKKLFPFRNSELSPSEKKEISNLHEQYPLLADAYECRDTFLRIYDATNKESAVRVFEEWRNLLDVRELNEFRELADAVADNFEDVFAYWDAPSGLTNTFSEIGLGITQKLNQIESGYSFEVLRAKMMYKDYAKRIEQILASPDHNQPQHGAYISRPLSE